VAADHPDVIAEMMRDIEAHQAKLKPAPSQLEL
jgi:hypothetical protein